MNDAPNSGADHPKVKNTPEVAPVNERAARLGPDWDFKPSDIAWACSNRDRQDVWQSLRSRFIGGLNMVKTWFKR